MKQKNKFDGDIVIVGGGITGSSLACLLGEAGFSIILLDNDIKSEHTPENKDPRVFAITIASKEFLGRQAHGFL